VAPSHQTMRLLVCGLIGPALFVAGVVIQDAFKPGFDPSRQFISHLSLGPFGWVNSALLVVSGGLIVLFGIGFRRLLQADPRARRIAVPIVLFGGSLIAAGMFVIDPGLGYPPGPAPDAPTWYGTLHDIAGGLAFLAVTAGTVMTGRSTTRLGAARASYVACAVIVVAFAVTSMLAGLDYSGSYRPAPAGLVERIYLITAVTWVAALAWRARRTAATAARLQTAATIQTGLSDERARYSSRKFSK
jgi:hypothetical membrane protein